MCVICTSLELESAIMTNALPILAVDSSDRAAESRDFFPYLIRSGTRKTYTMGINLDPYTSKPHCAQTLT